MNPIFEIYSFLIFLKKCEIINIKFLKKKSFTANDLMS